jgi:cytoskeletal protein RodZ
MPTTGKKLKTAPESKGVTQSEVAAETKMMTKIIDAMERNDFSSMAAPTYVKGFIRLYATHLGIDPAPLVDEYLSQNPSNPVNLSKRENPTQHKQIVNERVLPGRQADHANGFKTKGGDLWKKLPVTSELAARP